MRAADSGFPFAKTRAPRIVALLLCSALCACGQRGPLYYPKLPPLPAQGSLPAPSAAAPVTPVPNNLPTPQTRLLDGTPTTVLVAPDVSLPEAGLSTMPAPTQAVPAATPPAGTATTPANSPGNATQVPAPAPAPTNSSAPATSGTQQ